MPVSSILTITETEPTPLLRDFATFIQHLRTSNIALTRKNEFITGKSLYELNQEMTYPVPNTTPKSSQTFYPLLHLFYHLILAGKLFYKAPEKGNKLVLKPLEERLPLYEELRPVEKYFFLLETFWVDTNWKKAQGGSIGQSPSYAVPIVLLYLSQQQPGVKIKLKGEEGTPGLAQIFWN